MLSIQAIAIWKTKKDPQSLERANEIKITRRNGGYKFDADGAPPPHPAPNVTAQFRHDRKLESPACNSDKKKFVQFLKKIWILYTPTTPRN